jgi:hypothetical protein
MRLHSFTVIVLALWLSVAGVASAQTAGVGGFGIATITPSGSPWTTLLNFNGDVAPFSASFAVLDQVGVTHTSSASATMDISDDWATVAVPILAPGGVPEGIFATLGY